MNVKAYNGRVAGKHLADDHFAGAYLRLYNSSSKAKLGRGKLTEAFMQEICSSSSLYISAKTL